MEFSDMQKKQWAYFQKIAELESELDSLFPTDELMQYYFKPIKTKEIVPGNLLSLGAFLLTFPDTLDYGNGYAGLYDYYQNADIEKRLFYFCDIYLFSSTLQDQPKCKTITEFIKVVDSILVETEDKWKLIDVAADPCKHLDKLRPLIEAVQEQITQRAAGFRQLIEIWKGELDRFKTSESLMNFINIEMPFEDIETAVFYPSLLLFSGFLERTYGDIPQFFLGAFFPSLIRMRGNKGSITNHAEFLKILSDSTRLNALYALCHNCSYGQELAEQIGGSRNAMYYHLDKLFSFGLVTRKETEYRTLYTMNKRAVYERLTALRDFLVDGWQPGDDDAQEE